MNLLFKREQTDGVTGKVTFRLWAKTELDEDEQHIITRYRFSDAKLIEVLQPTLLRNAIILGVVSAVAVIVLFFGAGFQLALLLGIRAGGGAGYLYYDRNRESILVKDLIHGRYFACDNVVELSRKEAWLAMVVSFLRQVMESAKHWDGTETIPIEALSKQEAKYIAVKGL